MSKILDASCSAAGVVTAEGATVEAAEVLSEGNQASTGVLLMEGEKARYLTSSATDIKETIEKLIAVLDDLGPALTQIATTLTSIGAGMTGPTTAPPPTLPADVIELLSKVTSLTATKAELTTLKGALK